MTGPKLLRLVEIAEMLGVSKQRRPVAPAGWFPEAGRSVGSRLSLGSVRHSPAGADVQRRRGAVGAALGQGGEYDAQELRGGTEND